MLEESPAACQMEQKGEVQEQYWLFWHCLELSVMVDKLLNLAKTDSGCSCSDNHLPPESARKLSSLLVMLWDKGCRSSGISPGHWVFDVVRSVAPLMVPSEGSCTGDMFAHVVPAAVSKQGGRDLLSNLSNIVCSGCTLAPLPFELLARSQNLSHVLTPTSDIFSDVRKQNIKALQAVALLKNIP